MSLKSVHQGAVTACRAAEILGFSFAVYAAGTAPDTIYDGSGNVVDTVTRNGAGSYTVQLNKPYPRQLVSWCTSLTLADGSTHDERPYLITNGYNATNGTIDLRIQVDDGTPANGDPNADGRLCFQGLFIGSGGNSLVQ